MNASRRRAARRIGRGLALVGGVVVVALLVRALGAGRIADYLREVGPGFALLPLCYLGATVLYALPLGVVLETRPRPPLRSLLAGHIAALSVNAATPLLGVGGEPVRLLWLPKALRRRAVAGLVVDRGAYLLASALFWWRARRWRRRGSRCPAACRRCSSPRRG